MSSPSRSRSNNFASPSPSRCLAARCTISKSRSRQFPIKIFLSAEARRPDRDSGTGFNGNYTHTGARLFDTYYTFYAGTSCYDKSVNKVGASWKFSDFWTQFCFFPSRVEKVNKNFATIRAVKFYASWFNTDNIARDIPARLGFVGAEALALRSLIHAFLSRAAFEICFGRK